MWQSTIAGNVGSAQPLNREADGRVSLQFSVAVNDKKRNPQTGEWDQITTWFTCFYHGARAEGIAPYITQGRSLTVVGRTSARMYPRQDGSMGMGHTINVDAVALQGGKSEDSGQANAQPGAAPNGAPPAQNAPATQPQNADYAQNAYGAPANNAPPRQNAYDAAAAKAAAAQNAYNAPPPGAPPAQAPASAPASAPETPQNPDEDDLDEIPF